jgi:hypothetical protein
MSFQTGDSIDSLPVDESVPSHEDIQTVNALFQKEKSMVMKIFDEVKSVLLVAILFVVFSLPIIDSTLGKFIPIVQTSWIALIAIKAVAVMVVFYFVNNFYLLRK